MSDAKPSNWELSENDHYWSIQNSVLPGHAPAYGREGAVTTALNGLAARVGIGILREGGSALDAALATAFVQIVLGGGAVTSFFWYPWDRPLRCNERGSHQFERGMEYLP